MNTFETLFAEIGKRIDGFIAEKIDTILAEKLSDVRLERPTTQEVETKVEAQPVEAESPKKEKRPSPATVLITKLGEMGVKHATHLSSVLKMYEAIKKGENYKAKLHIKESEIDYYLALFNYNPSLWSEGTKSGDKLYKKLGISRAQWGAYVAIMCGHGCYSFAEAEKTINQLMSMNNGARRVWDTVRPLMFTPNGEVTQLKINLFN